MHPDPNKFLTVLFSFIPGAGHMYLGLLKRGASFMLAFFACIFAAAAFNFLNLFSYAFGFLIPVVWFIAFFDFWRFPRMSPEEKALVSDEFLIPSGMQLPGEAVMHKIRIAAGVLLILAGLYQLYRIFLRDMIYLYLHSERLIFLFNRMPTMLGGLAIIAVGLLLIFWKSRQLRREAQYGEE